jgi:hypothetical protein
VTAAGPMIKPWSDRPVSTPQDITRHHDDGEVVNVGAHPTGYVVRIEDPDPTWPQRYAELERAKRAALARVDAPGAGHGAPGLGMRYKLVKQPVVREIYERMFRAAGLTPWPELTTSPASSST